MDVQWYGRRERDIFNRFVPREAMSKAPNPRGPDQTYQARLTWDDVEWLRKTVRLPIGVKGIMTPDDARRAVERGVEIIWVSNHGGRQLDHTQSTIDALPPIVDAVESSPSQRRVSSMPVTHSGRDRATSVSSMRRRSSPPWWRA